ncbi:hypothetical protein CK228_12845 [Mesorhizobium sp. WSM4312]|nr:hypothetical protein CK228_12845 [Mesorhizobium sp. WSM4312]
MSRIAYSFLEIRSLLQLHIASINAILEKVRYGMIDDIDDVMAHDSFITHDPIYACSSFVDIFNNATNRPEKIWALCVDELEIMPRALQRQLFSYLRSVDQRIVVKLATSPFSGISWERTSEEGPMVGHDYTPINLAFANKKDAKRFTAKLFDALLNAEGMRYRGRRPAERAESVLGTSLIQEANSSHLQRRAYVPPDGEHYKRFANLRDNDVAFRQFLEDRNIDLETVYKEPEDRRAGLARKYIWQVAIRNEYGPTNIFRRSDESVSSRSPSRKRLSDAYLGYDSLITVCEGNPRTTIGLLRPLVKHFVGEGSEVLPEIQASYLQSAIAKYVSLLATIPIERDSRSIIDVLDQIGEYLSFEVNGPTFKPEPSLSIRIDRNVPAEIQEAIGNAMNQGAFVMLSDDIGLFDFGSVSGARLRLSYMLCPRYHLPLTFGKSINLSTILGQERGRRRYNNNLSINDLFSAAGDE